LFALSGKSLVLLENSLAPVEISLVSLTRPLAPLGVTLASLKIPLASLQVLLVPCISFLLIKIIFLMIDSGINEVKLLEN
jgi:hypothetical protein